MCGLSFPMVSKKIEGYFLSEGGKRRCVSLASNGSWESHQKKSGSLLVNHDLGDQLKIVLCLFWGSGLSCTFTKNYYPRKYKFLLVRLRPFIHISDSYSHRSRLIKIYFYIKEERRYFYVTVLNSFKSHTYPPSFGFMEMNQFRCNNKFIGL